MDNILGLANISDPTREAPSGNGRDVRARWRDGMRHFLMLDAPTAAD